MKKIKILAILIAVSIIGASAFYFLYYKKTPTYALLTIYQSVRNHDVETFKTYVDTDSVASYAYDEIIEYYVKDVGMEEGSIFVGVSKFIKPFFVDTVKDKLLEYVATKKEKTDPKENEPKAEKPLTKNKNINKIFEKVKPRKLDLKGFGDNTIEGDTASVTVNLFDPEAQKDVTLVAKLNKTNNIWRLVRITNLKDYFEL